VVGLQAVDAFPFQLLSSFLPLRRHLFHEIVVDFNGSCWVGTSYQHQQHQDDDCSGLFDCIGCKTDDN
jgi:hypothetical protein